MSLERNYVNFPRCVALQSSASRGPDYYQKWIQRIIISVQATICKEISVSVMVCVKEIILMMRIHYIHICLHWQV
jgi:hypothetical protein